MGYTDASKYELLYDLPKGEYRKAEVGGIRTRTIRAGNTIEVECYPLTRIGPAAVRELERRRKSREAQEKANRRNAERKCRRYIEVNFDGNDWVLTLTWDYGAIDRFTMSQADADALWKKLRLPVTEEEARRALNNYYRRIKTRMRQLGENPAEFKHLYVLEITRGKVDGWEHYHFHVVLHAPGLTADALKQLWPFGFARCDRLSFRDDGPARLAHYLTKQHTTEEVTPDGKRLRRWGHSQNLKEPDVTVSDRKLSRRRAAKIAMDVVQNGVEIFEKLYPGYKCVETPVVKFSEFVAGAYIYARLRKAEDMRPPWERAAGRRARD